MSAYATIVDEDRAWWRQAACAGYDPGWWSEDRPNMPAAVRVCVGCPVRSQCLQEALDHQDEGVIRGGTWLAYSRLHGYSITPLICAHCQVRPVRFTRTGTSRYCGRTCQVAHWGAGDRARRLAAAVSAPAGSRA